MQLYDLKENVLTCLGKQFTYCGYGLHNANTCLTDLQNSLGIESACVVHEDARALHPWSEQVAPRRLGPAWVGPVPVDVTRCQVKPMPAVHRASDILNDPPPRVRGMAQNTAQWTGYPTS